MYLTLEALLGPRLEPTIDANLQGRCCRLSVCGDFLIDDYEAAPCLLDSLRGTAAYQCVRENALDDAREILRAVGDTLPEGATVRLYGIEFNRVDENWKYDP